MLCIVGSLTSNKAKDFLPNRLIEFRFTCLIFKIWAKNVNLIIFSKNVQCYEKILVILGVKRRFALSGMCLSVYFAQVAEKHCTN